MTQYILDLYKLKHIICFINEDVYKSDSIRVKLDVKVNELKQCRCNALQFIWKLIV